MFITYLLFFLVDNVGVVEQPTTQQQANDYCTVPISSNNDKNVGLIKKCDKKEKSATKKKRRGIFPRSSNTCNKDDDNDGDNKPPDGLFRFPESSIVKQGNQHDVRTQRSVVNDYIDSNESSNQASPTVVPSSTGVFWPPSQNEGPKLDRSDCPLPKTNANSHVPALPTREKKKNFLLRCLGPFMSRTQQGTGSGDGDKKVKRKLKPGEKNIKALASGSPQPSANNRYTTVEAKTANKPATNITVS